MTFHKSQIEAIGRNRGPMMVLAGSGSDKATVVTHRTKHLIEECGMDSSKILVITFTRAAAREMRERFEHLIDDKPSRVSFGTFCPILFTILKYVYRYDASNVARGKQRTQFVKELMDRPELNVEGENEFVNSVLTEISSVKGGVVNLEHYYARNCSEETFKRPHNGYRERMQQANLIDFGDMLVMCYELFAHRKNILEAWQGRYRYILIGEFQDINRIQYEIMRMLARSKDNFFIARDGDQSVYRFHDAKPEIMPGFGDDYPEAKTVPLGRNYRSTEDIVKPAIHLIEHNKKRYEKEITAERGSGRPIITVACKDAMEETQKIVSELQGYVQTGYQLADIAALYRINMNPRLLVERLMEYDIPFHMKDTLPNLYKHWITKNILSYIRTTRGDLNRANTLQIINHPDRCVSRDSLGKQVVSFEAIKSFYQGKNWMVERIEQLECDLKTIKTVAPTATVIYIRETVGYDDYLRKCAGFRHLKPEELLEVPDQLLGSAAAYKTMDAWYAHMKEYGERLKQKAQDRTSKPEGVAPMTMYSFEGLEFQVVCIMDTNEGITPHRKAMLDADMEEERRMSYVAMAEAKDRLHVCYVKEHYGRRREASRFIEEYLKPSKSVTVRQ